MSLSVSLLMNFLPQGLKWSEGGIKSLILKCDIQYRFVQFSARYKI